MTITVTDLDLPSRITARIEIGSVPADGSRPLDTPCWLWTGGKFPAGYGSCWLNGRSQLVHRVIWEAVHGPPPPRESLEVVDHVCRVRACCNPAHLELVSATENQLRRADSRGATHCANGHPWADNERPVRGKPNQRTCRSCGREKARRYRQRRKSS